MDNRTIVVWALTVVILGGCASANMLISAWGKPGEKMLDPPEQIYQKYNCRNETLPLVIVEQNTLFPRNLNLKIIKKLNHRLIYGLCSDKHNSDIVGKLYTRIYHHGTPLISDVDETYAIKAGRWQVDTFITLLEELDAGVYTLEIEFSSPAVAFKVENTFVVESG